MLEFYFWCSQVKGPSEGRLPAGGEGRHMALRALNLRCQELLTRDWLGALGPHD